MVLRDFDQTLPRGGGVKGRQVGKCFDEIGRADPDDERDQTEQKRQNRGDKGTERSGQDHFQKAPLRKGIVFLDVEHPEEENDRDRKRNELRKQHGIHLITGCCRRLCVRLSAADPPAAGLKQKPAE